MRKKQSHDGNAETSKNGNRADRMILVSRAHGAKKEGKTGKRDIGEPNGRNDRKER